MVNNKEIIEYLEVETEKLDKETDIIGKIIYKINNVQPYEFEDTNHALSVLHSLQRRRIEELMVLSSVKYLFEE